jgi:hypothetical protein
MCAEMGGAPRALHLGKPFNPSSLMPTTPYRNRRKGRGRGDHEGRTIHVCLRQQPPSLLSNLAVDVARGLIDAPEISSQLSSSATVCSMSCSMCFMNA